MTICQGRSSISPENSAISLPRRSTTVPLAGAPSTSIRADPESGPHGRRARRGDPPRAAPPTPRLPRRSVAGRSGGAGRRRRRRRAPAPAARGPRRPRAYRSASRQSPRCRSTEYSTARRPWSCGPSSGSSGPAGSGRSASPERERYPVALSSVSAISAPSADHLVLEEPVVQQREAAAPVGCVDEPP